MGLDWKPMGRSKRGHHEEHEKLFRAMKKREPTPKQIERFQEISEPPYVTLNAPRVGFDKAADAWLKKRLTENKRASELATVRESMHGYYVLELLPECDGFPVYSNGGMYEGVDRCSFRAQFLEDVEDVLGKTLFARAWESMLAPELLAYGHDIEKKVIAFAKKHDVAHVAKTRECEFEEDTDAFRAHIMFAASKWCVFWAERRFGLEPYY